jgi:hypothetical protein
MIQIPKMISAIQSRGGVEPLGDPAASIVMFGHDVPLVVIRRNSLINCAISISSTT